MGQNGEEIEESDSTWSRREGARMRQILIGKARPEYKRYVSSVPVEQRDPTHPRTPDPRQRVSKRQFDRNLGEWRKKLHEFDAKPWAVACAPPVPSADDPSPTDSPSRAARPQHGRTPRRQRPGRGERPAAAAASASSQGPQTSVAFGGEVAVPEATGVVQLRLADQLPEFPLVVPQWHQSCEAEGGSPQPVTPQRSGMQMGPTFCEDGATPAPVAGPTKLLPPPPEHDVDKVCADAAMRPQMLFTPVSAPCFQVPEGGAQEAFASYEVASGGASGAGRRWPTPPPMPSGTPRTPERTYGAPSPPSSCLKTPKTPPRGNWVMDTPSPQRFHYQLNLPSQVMPPPEDPSYSMGPLCGMGWASNTWDFSMSVTDLSHWE